MTSKTARATGTASIEASSVARHVIDSPIAIPRLGMARSTGISGPTQRRMSAIETAVAVEITTCRLPSSVGATASRSSSICCGCTQRMTTSAPFTAARLSESVWKPSAARSARSSTRLLVTATLPDSTNPEVAKPLAIAPPRLPPPRMATLLICIITSSMLPFPVC